MLFLVCMESNLGGIPDEQAAEIRAEETKLGMSYIRSGLIRRVFRIVGRDGNVSIWEVGSLDELHDALRALPKVPWAHVSVMPLIEHPVEVAYKAQHGSLPAVAGPFGDQGI